MVSKHHRLFCVSGVFVCRIVDNMPVTWCYDVEEGQKFCNPGFPIGCYVTEQGRPKDACVVNVSGQTLCNSTIIPQIQSNTHSSSISLSHQSTQF